jgi:hypothetical protein
MEPVGRSTRKFTAIWQSSDSGRDWPLFNWLNRIFEPYISNHVFDGAHQMVMDNAILFDAWVYANDPDYYAKFRGKNAFLVHIGDEFYELGVDRYRHFRGVFRNYFSSAFNPKHVMVLPLGSYVPESPTSIVKASERRYAWSFIGDGGKTSRPEMIRAMSSFEPHLCFSTTPVRGISFLGRSSSGEEKRIAREETFEILGQSAFAPTPMGNGNLEANRTYDALEVGAIPILERRWSLDYYRQLLGHHPLPTFGSWSQARQLVIHLLKDPVKLDELQQTCMEWWKSYKVSLVENIGSFLEERSRAIDELEPLQSRLPRLPLWQYTELLRHHSMPAIGRRLALQAKRMVSKKRWRLASRKS